MGRHENEGNEGCLVKRRPQSCIYSSVKCWQGYSPLSSLIAISCTVSQVSYDRLVHHCRRRRRRGTSYSDVLSPTLLCHCAKKCSTFAALQQWRPARSASSFAFQPTPETDVASRRGTEHMMHHLLDSGGTWCRRITLTSGEITAFLTVTNYKCLQPSF